jgi:hypothetical protein
MNTPAARREVLVFVAGAVWSLVGLALATVAGYWLIFERLPVWLPLTSGLICGYLIYRFGFSRLAHRNLERIYAQSPQKDKVCVFAFQNTRSYILVTVMMAMGYGLRHSGLSKVYLSPVYLAIGSALLFSSVLYYKRLWLSV